MEDKQERIPDADVGSTADETGQHGGQVQPTRGDVESKSPASGEATTDLTKMAEQLRKAVERADDLANRWQRTQADFINFKRRAEQERGELTKVANLTLIARILPVLDDLERAMATLPRELYTFTWLEGIALIQRKLQYLLEQEGLTPIEAEGQDFDPGVHEAVMVEEGVSLHDSKVVAQLQRGYRLHDRVLRPSLVKVGRGAAETGKE